MTDEITITTFAQWQANNLEMKLQDICSTDMGDGFPHPLFRDLHGGGIVREVTLMGTFDDDNETCYAFRVKTDAEDYVITLWWVVPECVDSLYKCVGSAERCAALVLQLHPDIADRDAEGVA